MLAFRWAWALLVLGVGCSVYDPNRLPSLNADGAVNGADTGIDARMPDTSVAPDTSIDEDSGGGDAQVVDGGDCLPGIDEFCTRVCPETCNRQDDDCDGQIDEEQTEGETCQLASANAVCIDGECAIIECLDGQRDCDQLPGNGCEAGLDDANHCGRCGARCSYAHGIGVCSDGVCTLGECEAGYGDCDDDAGNGCELRLDSPDNCGACDVVCGGVVNGQTGCVAGVCAITECDGGYDDCDGELSNGCETALDTAEHCGTCELACTFETAGALCSAMTCVPDGCNSGLGDCDGDPANGCEIALRDDEDNCGVCGGTCRANLLANTQAASCLDGTCTATTCTAQYGDCDDEASNGCESSLRTLAHCGMCDRPCAFTNGIGSCDSGGCVFVNCAPGFGNCDNNLSNGCETPLNTLTHCGACNQECTVSSGTAACTGGVCTNAACNPGFADCDGDGGSCETNLTSDNTHCGACGSSCGALPHATGQCMAGACRIQACDAGWGNCDGNHGNGCETALNTTSNCGICGRACSYDRAGASCNAGSCAMGTCNPGWANCDNSSGNGCETQLNTLTSCASCGDTCSLPDAVEACSSGSCIVVTCDSDDLGNCDGNNANGCERSLNTLTDCGGCGMPCNLPNASESCVARTCQLDACNPGFANCDSVRTNGCERSTRTLTDCGGCGVVCDLANASESCSTGACTLTTCAAGFGNCDGNDSNGCEQPLNTLTHCGACDATCSLSNAGESCASGSCQVTTCDSNYGDCDGNATNGCEQSLITLAHCGACDMACDPDNATGSCQSGMCTITSCDADFGDCDGLASTGCERDLNGGDCRPGVGRIDIDDEHSCAVKGDGRVACWGFNGSGRLGDGSTVERWAPGLASTLLDAIAVSAGDQHACAVRQNGQVMCWGDNGSGRLGDGTTTERRTPVTVSGINDAVGVSVGANFSCALRQGGQVMCWGYNANGRLGDGTSTTRNTPVLVSGISDALQVSAGEEHACALRGNGTIACWGNNTFGRLGDGTASDRATPITVMGISDATQVSAGEAHTCAVRQNGQVMCWGYNANGRLGDNTITERRTPVAALMLSDAVQVSAGYLHTCAVRQNGQVMCWGYNANGRLGDNTSTERRVPTAVIGLSDAIEVTTGDHHTCAMRVGGQAMCWGYGAIGRLGDGTTSDRLVPAPVAGFSGATRIEAGGVNSCARLSSGQIHCWGYGGRNGTGTSTLYRGTVAAVGLTNAADIATGWEHACALLQTGQVWCWGTNNEGQLGDGTTTARTAPVRAGTIADAVQVSTNGWSTCAVASDGRMYCWGYNGQGQLGFGHTLPTSVPAVILGLTDARQVALGNNHTCYLRADNSVRCAGEAGSGQLGNGSTLDQTVFVNVNGITNATQVTTGYYHSCALRTGGTISCWGDNRYGQLGDNSTTNRTAPVTVMGISDATKVSGGEFSTCALRGNGQVMCWGYNALGRLGDGTLTNRSTPVTVLGIGDAIDIDVGEDHACALRQNGEALCWGYNGYGQLGDGTVTDRSSAVPVVPLP